MRTRLFEVASRRRLWDAIVIGAGPAGAIAARQLALQGKSVLLVDKGRFPRDKVCGGCLGSLSLHMLHSLGLEHVLDSCGAVSLNSFTLAAGGFIASAPIHPHMAISRSIFDEALAQSAVQAGAVFCDQTLGSVQSADGPSRSVALRCDDEQVDVEARVVIVATGLSKNPAGCATHIAARSRIGLGAKSDQQPCALSQGAIGMALGRDGYVGVVQLDEHQYDIAAAVDPVALAAHESPAALVHRIMQQGGFEPLIDFNELSWRGVPPLTRRTGPLGSHRCLLVGDAARYVEPFTGEGIGWAMYSGWLTASILTGSLEEWDDTIPATWARSYQAHLGRSQHSCHRLCKMLRSRTLRHILMWGLRRAPTLSLPIIQRFDRPIEFGAQLRAS